MGLLQQSNRNIANSVTSVCSVFPNRDVLWLAVIFRIIEVS